MYGVDRFIVYTILYKSETVTKPKITGYKTRSLALINYDPKPSFSNV